MSDDGGFYVNNRTSTIRFSPIRTSSKNNNTATQGVQATTFPDSFVTTAHLQGPVSNYITNYYLRSNYALLYQRVNFPFALSSLYRKSNSTSNFV